MRIIEKFAIIAEKIEKVIRWYIHHYREHKPETTMHQRNNATRQRNGTTHQRRNAARSNSDWGENLLNTVIFNEKFLMGDWKKVSVDWTSLIPLTYSKTWGWRVFMYVNSDSKFEIITTKITHPPPGGRSSPFGDIATFSKMEQLGLDVRKMSRKFSRHDNTCGHELVMNYVIDGKPVCRCYFWSAKYDSVREFDECGGIFSLSLENVLKCKGLSYRYEVKKKGSIYDRKVIEVEEGTVEFLKKAFGKW